VQHYTVKLPEDSTLCQFGHAICNIVSYCCLIAQACFNPRASQQHLRWTDWHWDTFCSKHFNCHFTKCPILVCISVWYNRVQ